MPLTILSPLPTSGSTGNNRGSQGKAPRHRQVGTTCANAYTETPAGFRARGLSCPLRAASAPSLALLCSLVLFLGTETAAATSDSDPAQESTDAPVNVTITVTATPGVQ